MKLLNWKKLSDKKPEPNHVIIICDKRGFDEKYFVGQFDWDPDMFCVLGDNHIHISVYGCEGDIFWDNFEEHRCDE